MTSLSENFHRYVAQTSSEPMGIDVVRAQGCILMDRSGREYLDFLSGIGVANIGHGNPVVIDAIGRQAAQYLHVMVYGEFVEAPQVELARLLAEITPAPLSVTYFTSTGTEAIEGALKLARKFTRRAGFVSFEGSYHGGTLGALSVQGNPRYRAPFEPLLPDVRFLPFDDVTKLEAIDETIASVLVEPIQGEGGVRVPGDEFLPALRRRCNEVGALLIFDEVMTGFGRTGRLFAGDHWEVVPDILVMAKAMGGGLPLGGFMSRPEVMRSLAEDPPFTHVTTFGGHPLSCAAGLAALRYLLKESLPDRAAQSGKELLRRLGELQSHRGLREIRGKGLLIGIEFEEVGRCREFVRRCREKGLLLESTLHRPEVVRLAPPLIVSADEIDRAVEVMRGA